MNNMSLGGIPMRNLIFVSFVAAYLLSALLPAFPTMTMRNGLVATP